MMEVEQDKWKLKLGFWRTFARLGSLSLHFSSWFMFIHWFFERLPLALPFLCPSHGAAAHAETLPFSTPFVNHTYDIRFKFLWAFHAFSRVLHIWLISLSNGEGINVKFKGAFKGTDSVSHW